MGVWGWVYLGLAVIWAIGLIGTCIVVMKRDDK